MSEAFQLELLEKQADTELHDLLARAYTVRMSSSEDRELDYSFTIILIGFLISDDPVSRWFQRYTEDTNIRVNMIFDTKSVKLEDAKQATPTKISFSERSRFSSSSQSIFSEAIQIREQTTNTTGPTFLLGVRHLMAAYIYRPGTHEPQLKQYGFDRVDWSNSFLNFVQQQYPQDNLNSWFELHRSEFKDEPLLSPSPIYRTQRPWNDAVVGEDLLNVTSEAYALADMLLLRDFDPPICAGIFGGWGSGKSFFMRLVYDRMMHVRSLAIEHEDPWSEEAATHYPQVGHVYLIRFDAWTFAKTNLWASLVQTLFLELNRQLSIEACLSHEGPEGLKSGNLWQSLFFLSDADMERFDDPDVLHKALESWKDGQERTADDVLWETLNAVQGEQIAVNKERIEEKQRSLAQKRSQLATVEAKLATVNAGQDAALDTKALAQTVSDELNLNNLGEYMREALKQADEPINLSQSLRLLWLEFTANRRNIAIILVLIVVALVIVLGGQTLLDEGTAQLVSVIGVLGSVIAGLIRLRFVTQPVFELIKEWNSQAQELHRKYREKRTDIYNEEEANLQVQRTQLRRTIAQQEAETVLLQNQAALTDRFNSMSDFVAQRTQMLSDSDLGILHEVQQDLRELTDAFAQGYSRDETAKERFRNKFPRGPARAVLFIDDLDRCPPEKVVEVLEATQLLLKTKLFVVVLALDIRYVSRALEKEYDQILTRNGSPSGLDYIEKIIQIPYHMRPVASDGINRYLSAQMDVEDSDPDKVEHLSQPQGTQNAAHRISTSSETQDIHSPASGNGGTQPPPDSSSPDSYAAINFSQVDFETVHRCCQHIDMVPRAIKRLINVGKLLKLLWSRSPHGPLSNYDEVFKTAVFLLACSERYPRLMLEIFEELISKSRMGGISNKDTLFKTFIDYTPYRLKTHRQQRQWEELHEIVETRGLLPEDLTFDEMSFENLSLIRSFCFLGDIVDDPDDHDNISISVTCADAERNAQASSPTPSDTK